MPSSIHDFYKDQTVFITGGTGFVGKVVIEKLLRKCRVYKILVLVRSKRGKTTEERFEKIFSYPCFNRLKSKNFDFKSKVELISGDCSEEKLGLSENDWNYLVENVDVIVHAAADVKFDRSLKYAAHSNVRAVKDILTLAKSTRNLKSLVYVSTAFSSCHQQHIKEEFYEPGMSAEALLTMVDTLDEDALEILTPSLISKWQNTYIYTKAIAEDLIKTQGKTLPVAIVRPAIISGSAKEPMSGWIDNFYGPIGFLTGIYVGFIRAVMLDLNKSSEFVPVDYVCNLILAIGWKNHQKERNSQVQIYNFAGSNDNMLTWRETGDQLDEHMNEFPTNKKLWIPIYFVTKCRYAYNIVAFLLHTLPSYLIDFILVAMRKKPQAIKGYQKFHHLAEMTVFFRMHLWTWDDGNWKSLWKCLSENDKEMFNFNMDGLNWPEYLRQSAIGVRTYLVKDPMSSLDAAKKKTKILTGIHYVLVVMLMYAFCKFSIFVLLKMFLVAGQDVLIWNKNII